MTDDSPHALPDPLARVACPRCGVRAGVPCVGAVVHLERVRVVRGLWRVWRLIRRLRWIGAPKRG